MCGITGVVGGDPARELEAVRTMTATLAHRGPDDGGVEQAGAAILGNRRLAIMDPGAPGQPMTTDDGRFVITFNGEIYNHVELRRELEAAGHRFRTRTDTEVVLRLFAERGAQCLTMLRGMFACAIWDRRRERLFAARDPFGQKPFHYAVVGGRFIFASEIKALLAHPAISAEPELEAVDHYLTQRFVPPPLTMLRGVRKLPAGHHLLWENGALQVAPWWELDFRHEEDRPDEEWIAELERRVDLAVRRHLVSDVPMGALLSGGLDSSAVVAAMARAMDEPFPTFCVGTEVASLDERPFARMVAEHLGTIHHERRVGDEVLGGIPDLVRCLDEPSDPIAACTWEAARLAATQVKVVLGGDGGDELFGGFDRYAAFPWAELYARVPAGIRRRLAGPMAKALPGAGRYKSFGQKARWLNDLNGRRGGALYARMTSVFRFGPDEKQWCYGPRLAGAATGAAETLIERAFDEAPARDDLHRMLAADVATRLPEHSLLLADRLSMAHGLELRSPLLDVDLAAFCARMPSRLKVRRNLTKVALRRAFDARLPTDISKRPKQGFMLPVAYWLRGSSLDRVRDTLEAGPLVREGWIASGAASRLAGEHARGRADHHVRLWMLINLDVWVRLYLKLGGSGEWPDEQMSSTMVRTVR